MKREYRKYNPESSRKAKSDAANPNDELQIPFGRTEVQRVLREELDNFAVEMGRTMVIGLLEDEVRRLCGNWHIPDSKRTVTRHGAQPGWVILGGQKATIQRPRVRFSQGQGEAPLPLYERMHDRHAMTAAVMRRMLRGVSCRNYEGVVDCARGSYGVKRSSVSKAFVETMADEVRPFCERRWDGIRFVAIYIDGKAYAGEMMIVALGLKADGTKAILGLRQGATENADVVKDLLEDLVARGVAADQMTLFVLDGAKALTAAVKQVFGRYGLIQRCQVHKRRNIMKYLGKAHWSELRRRLAKAYNCEDYDQALGQLRNTVIWLRGINRDAAGSLEEGMAETLTVTRLGIPALLRRSLVSNNLIESPFSTAATLGGRVKYWKNSDTRWRWCVAGLTSAERHFRRTPGYKYIPRLIVAMDEIGRSGGLDRTPQVA
jgi:transposase-like protein